MKEFITANPGMVELFITGMFIVLGALANQVCVLVKQAFERLAKAITSLEESLSADRADIGDLKDRVQKQETTCQMQRQFCPITPHNTPPEIPLNSTTIISTDTTRKP